MKEFKENFFFDPVFNIKDSVIIIIGACGLIGKALCEELHKRQALLVIVDLPQTNPKKFAQRFDNAIAFECNISKLTAVKSLVENCQSVLSRIDVLINCHQYKPDGFMNNNPENFPYELWDEIIQVNLNGTFYCCSEFGNIMINQHKGVILNFASTYGIVSSNPNLYCDTGLANPVAYTSSKGGVIMMTKYLAVHWAKYGIRVNCITPHGVYNNHEETFVENFRKYSPIGRMMFPEELLGGVLYLISDASKYVTGSNLIIDGGWTAW